LNNGLFLLEYIKDFKRYFCRGANLDKICQIDLQRLSLRCVALEPLSWPINWAKLLYWASSNYVY